MKRIDLTQGVFTYVDEEDYDFLMQWKWCAAVRKNNKGKVKNVYARRGTSVFERRELGMPKTIEMHNFLMKTPKGLKTDHILNGAEFDRSYPELKWSGLLNIRSNLRIVTNAENMRNRKPQQGGSSIYKGVYWNKKSGKWKAQIRLNNKNIYLGYFHSEQQAARAYNEAAIKLHGDHALINEINAPSQLTLLYL